MAPPLHAQERTARIALPPGPLADSLRLLALQSGTGILFPPEIVRGLNGPRISGHMPVDRALQRLLQRSGLTFRKVNAGTFLIYVDKRPRARQAVVAVPSSRADEIIVTDSGRSGAIKRAADTAVVAVTELEAGRLPTLSLSDILSRLPGIRRNDTQSGENRYVSIRGMNNAAASQSIDGVLLTNFISRSRATSTEAVPSVLFGSAVVTTVATPDLDENSTAAHVALTTISGLDGEGESLLDARLLAGFSSRSGGERGTRQPIRASVTWRGKLDEAGRVGLALGAGVDRLGSRQDAVSVSGYRRIGDDLVPDGRLTRGQTFTRTQRAFGMARLDLRPSDRLALFAEFFHFSHDYTTDQITSAITVAADDASAGMRGSGRFATSGSAILGFNHLSSPLVRDRIVQVGGDYALGDKDRLSARAGVTFNRVRQNGIAVAGFAAPGNSLAIPVDYAVSGSGIELGSGSPSLIADPGRYLLVGRTTVSDLDSRDRNLFARVDFAHNADAQDTGAGFRLGAQVKTLHRRDTQGGKALLVAPGQTITLAEVSDASPLATLQPVAIDERRLLALIEARGGPVPDPNGVYDADPADGHGQDFHGTEQVFNLHATAIYAADNARIAAGFRVAYTRRTLLNQEPGPSGLWGPVRYRQDYWHLLPGIHGFYDASARLKLRAAFSRTLERPPINGSAKRLVTSYDTPVTRSTSYTSPFLKPIRSDNLEAAAEYYYGPYDAYLSVGVFGKSLRDIPATATVQTVAADGVREIVTYTGNVDEVNGRKVYGRMRGVEIAWADPELPFFPAALGRLGIMLSYAHIAYRVTAIDGTGNSAASGTRLVDAGPRDYVSATLYYDAGPFSANAFVQKQSSNPVLSYDPANDRRTSHGLLVDLQASYALSPGLRLMAEARNLLDQDIVDRYGLTGYGPAYQIRNNGRTIWIGAQFTLF